MRRKCHLEKFFLKLKKSDFEEICMPDTVKITNSDDDNYCVIVNGKGLVEFSIDGKLWSLAE
jgi:hypothetical protein